MTNTDYITVTANGFYIGDKQTDEINGHKIISNKHMIPADFNWAKNHIQETRGVTLEEYHVLQSNTFGDPRQIIDIDPEPSQNGTFCWVRYVYKDANDEKHTTKWCMYKEYQNAEECELNSVFNAGYGVEEDGGNTLTTIFMGEESNSVGEKE